jgi:hypothetical protein
MGNERPELPAELAEDMRRHLADEHGLDLDPLDDLANPHPRLAYELPTEVRRGRFHCRECRGEVFVVGQTPYGTQERNDDLRLRDPGIRASLAHVPPDRQDEFIEASDRGELAAVSLDQAAAKRAKATAKRRSGVAARRIAGAQEYLLDARKRHGKVAPALEELHDLARTEPARHLKITGQTTPIAIETLRKHWQAIPVELRRASEPDA